MSRFLFVWELGEGLGHVSVQRPLALALLDQGHDVVVAVRNVRSATTAFAGTGVPFIQCPYKTWKVTPRFTPIQTYAHILYESAFSSPDGLAALVAAWANLFELVKPDAIVYNHSPTALLAARNHAAKRILHGPGFASPPASLPLPRLEQVATLDRAQAEADEQHVLACVNEALSGAGFRPLAHMSDIYRDVDLNLLATYPELDHFAPRQNTRYWGVRPPMPAAAPQWPVGTGKKIFAYLKLSPGLGKFLTRLRQTGNPTVVFGTWVDESARAQFESASMKLVSHPLDIAAVAEECDLAVLNGTHGTTAELLLRGVPVLQLPIYVEQAIVAARTVKLGASLMAGLTDSDSAAAALERMLASEQYGLAAEGFAEKYRNSTEIGTPEEMVALVAALAT